MKQFQVAFVPIGIPAFHLESANDQFQKSLELLNALIPECVVPDSPLLSIDDLKTYIDTLSPDLVILQNTTFAHSAYVNEVIKAIDSPILLWTLREPVIDGTRLRLNSLTGAYSAGNLMHHMGKEYYEYIFGAPTEEKVKNFISKILKVAKLKYLISTTTIAVIGHTPQGFGFGRGLDAEISSVFGANLESIEAREMMARANSYTDDDINGILEIASSKMVGLDQFPEENINGFLRLYKAFKEYIDSKNIKAIASRCWPDFFTEYKTPVCAVLGMLNDINIAASCESDVCGALSLFIGIGLTGTPGFFGDLVSLNEEDSTITFWHCGTAACQLAHPDTGSTMGVHPNHKIGPTMEFGCKPCEKVTVFRIGRKPDASFRLFIVVGSAIDAPQKFYGTSIVVRIDTPSEDLVKQSVKDGWEPHFVISYGDIAPELEVLGNMLGLDVFKY